MKRNIKYLVVHCTATPPTATIEAIQNYWRNNLGWKNNGYHFIIKRSGEVVKITDEDIVANGVAGYNQESIHMSYIGGVDKTGKAVDNRTTQQQDSMYQLLVKLSTKYPKAEIKGHRDFPNVHKECPSFDVKQWLKTYEPSVLKTS